MSQKLRKSEDQRKCEKFILVELNREYFNIFKKQRSIKFSDYTDITIDNQTLTISICSKEGKNPIIENMQNDGTAFEGWAICLKCWIPNIKKVILKWELPVKGLINVHYRRFQFRVSNFEKMFSWFSYDNRHYQEITNFQNEFVGIQNNFGTRPPRRPQELGEKRVEYDLVNIETNQALMQDKFEINRLNHQLPVGVKKNGKPFFTCRASAIDMWGITNDKTLIIFELKYIKDKESLGNKSMNIKVGIISELLFYVCVLNEIFKNNIGKPISKLNEEKILYATDIKKIRGCFLANEYHPLLENNNVLKLLNENSLGIEFVKYNYTFLSASNLLKSIV